MPTFFLCCLFDIYTFLFKQKICWLWMRTSKKLQEFANSKYSFKMQEEEMWARKRQTSQKFIENNLNETRSSSDDQKVDTSQSQNLRKNLNSTSFSVKIYWWPREKKLTVFERGRIVELYKQGLTQNVPGWKQKDSDLNIQNNSEGYWTKMSSCRKSLVSCSHFILIFGFFSFVFWSSA